MIKLGRTIKHVREQLGLTQREVAQQLGISNVHLCNIENNEATTSLALVDRFREIWGIDLYILAWCLYGDVGKLPASAVRPVAELTKALQSQLRQKKDS